MIIEKLIFNGKGLYNIDTVGDRDMLTSLGADIEEIESEEIKRRSIEKINEEYESAINELLLEYTKHEVDTFQKQETEARAYILDNSVSTPFIDSLCSGRGIQKDIIVPKIIMKADAFAIAVGELTGIKQKKIDDLTL